MFDPVKLIERACVQLNVHPVLVIASIINALGLNHRDSVKGRQFAMTERDPQPEQPFRSVHDEIDALCAVLDPPRDPVTEAPASLLETLDLALSFWVRVNEHWAEEWRAEHGENDEGAEESLLMVRAQRALRLILRETMNEMERVGLEQALEDEPGAGDDDDGH